MVTAIGAGADAVTITDGVAVAGIITAGAIIAEPPFTGTRARHLIARARTSFLKIGRALRDRSIFYAIRVQPRPISTAIRIRSE